MTKVFLTGGSSGIGQICWRLLEARGYSVTAPKRDSLDLSNIDQLESLSMQSYDIVVNCAGANAGTYLGFHDNSGKNQVEQIQVNFIAPLLLAKNYSQSRPDGHFVYISSVSIDSPYLYNVVNASAKAALRYSMEILRKELSDFHVTEICPGKTKTNMLKQNYQGIKSEKEISDEYESSPYLTPEQVAECVLIAIDKKLDVIKLTPSRMKNGT